jgi:hypothetical protein
VSDYLLFILAYEFRLEMVPVRGYAKGGNVENVEFVGVAA